MSNPGVRRLCPNACRGVRDQPKFCLLLFDRQIVADDRRGEAALWTEGKPLLVDVACSLRDALGQQFWFLKRRPLGRNEPEHDHPVLRDKSERRKRA